MLGNGAAHRGRPRTIKEVALMRRVLLLVTVALVMAAMMLAMALPALAKNSEKADGGPPLANNNPGGTSVFHCQAAGGESVEVHHENGNETGNCRFS
jgi:putative hemolysin